MQKVEEDEKVAHPELRTSINEYKKDSVPNSAPKQGDPQDNESGRAVTYTDTENSPTPYRCCCYELKGDAVDTPERKKMLAQVCLTFMLISSYYAMVCTLCIL